MIVQEDADGQRSLNEARLVRNGSPRATAATVPGSNGMSSETLLFDIDHPSPPSAELSAALKRAGTPTSCALRLAADPAAYTIFPRYDMARQYRTMRLVAEHTDLPVPRTLWLEEDAAPLGAPFFVMARAAGRAPPDVMPYTYEGSWLYDATDAERERLEAASVSVLARLHDQVPPGEADFLATAGRGGALHRHVESQRAYYAWVVDGRPRTTVIERGFDWLTDHWPSDPGETRHRDAAGGLPAGPFRGGPGAQGRRCADPPPGHAGGDDRRPLLVRTEAAVVEDCANGEPGQALWRIWGTRIGRAPGPPMCEKG